MRIQGILTKEIICFSLIYKIQFWIFFSDFQVPSHQFGAKNLSPG